MKPAKQDCQESRQDQALGKAQGKAKQRRRPITVRLSRKVKLIYTWRARRRMPGLLLRLLTQAFASLLAGFTGHALAAPDGGTVASGSASISKPTTYQTIIKQDTPRAVINWNSYNVGAGERVTYQQPTSSSVTLNRVTGGDLSKIYGSIDANGVVVISNPAGVYFGQGAQVNVGGLVAGAMAISDADFNAGNYRFTGHGSGSVKNDGSIQAGAYGVALIGHTVDNSGRIESGGAVLLGAGGQATLKLAHDRLVDIAIDSSAVQAQVNNSGVIHADGGNIVLSARATDALLDTVLLAGGEMRADSLREVNGKIVLDGGSSGVVKVDGTLQARGLSGDEKGGEVKVTGERILLASNSLIDVSGQAGGGQVHVGGGYQGKDPTIAHATDVTMEKGALIRADATTKGDGGEAVLWSDHSTIFAGEISAKGGVEGGDGGRVETSGKYLQSTGWVSASAPKGKAGDWLIDPHDITIGNGPTTGMSNGTAISDSAFLNAQGVSDVLSAGTNVTIKTGTDGTQAGNITVSGHIDSNAGSTTSLTLEAAGQIFMESASRIAANNGPLNVALHAGGAINMDTGATISTKGGSVEATGTQISMNGVTTGSGAITLAGTGNISLTNASAQGGVDVQNTGASASVFLTDVATGAGKVTVKTDGLAALTDVSAGSGIVNVNGGSGVLLGRVQAGELTATSTQHIAGFDSVSVQGQSSFDAGGNVTFTSGANNFAGPVKFVHANNATLINSGGLQIEGTVGGDLDLTANGKISQSDALNVSGTTRLEVGTGNDIDLQQRGNSFAGSVTVQSAKDAYLANSRNLALSGTIENDLHITTEGKTTFGQLMVKGSLDATSSNGFGQTGAALTVIGTATLDGALPNPFDTTTPLVSSNILLGGSLNDFRDTVTFKHAADVLINNSGSLKLAGDVDGNLSVGSNGITQGDALSVGGNLSLNASTGNDINLYSFLNDFKGGVTIQSARNASIRSASLKIDGAVSGNLDANAAFGSLTQSQGLVVTGNSTLYARDDITLKNVANNFTGPVDLETALGNASLYNAGATAISGFVKGDLDVTAQGKISQGTRELNIGGTTTLKVENGGLLSSILLGSADNAFGGRVKFDGAFNTAINSGGPIQIEGSTGTLSVTAAGSITQSGALSSNGAVLTATGADHDILLTNGGNALAGTVQFDTTRDVSIVNAGGLNVSGHAGGNLALTATSGSITQTDALSVGGTATLKAQSAIDPTQYGDITLEHSQNQFTGPIAVTGRDVSLVSAGALNVSGHADGNLSLTAKSGEIFQTDALTVVGTTTARTERAGDFINLAHPDNDFGNAVTLDSKGELTFFGHAHSDLLINSAGVTQLAGRVDGMLKVVAAGPLKSNDALSVTGVTELTSTGSDNRIDLSSGGHDFTGAVTLNSAGQAAFAGHAHRDVTITSANGAQLEGTVDGALTVNTGGSITQFNALAVKGASSLTTTGNEDITLANAGNLLSGTVTFNGKRDVTLVNAGALDVSGEAGKDLTLTTSTGKISQSGILKAGGATTLTTQGSGDQVQLSNAGNDFTGDVSIASAGAAAFAGHAHGRLFIASESGAQLEGQVDKLLTVEAKGPITQTGALTAGAASFFTTTGAGNGIELNQANNNFTGNVTLDSSDKASFAGHAQGKLTITSAKGVELAGQVDNILKVDAAGSITQTGALKVTGASTFTTTDVGSGIALNKANNDFTGAVNINSSGTADFAGHAHDVTMTASNETKLEGQVDGKLVVTAGGKITQDHALNVVGQSTLTTTGTGKDIVLDQDANTFGQKVVFKSSGAVDLHNSNDLILEGSAGTTLNIKSAGSIGQSAMLSSGSTATFTSTGTDKSITLENPGNDFAGATSLASVGDVSVRGKFGDILTVQTDTGNVTLSGTVANGLLVTAGQSISQGTAPIVVTNGATTLKAGQSGGMENSVDLGGSGNVFGGDLTVVAGSQGPRIGGHVKGDLKVTSEGQIEQADALTVDHKSTFVNTHLQDTPGAFAILLTNSNNVFSEGVTFSAPGDVKISSAAALQLEGSAGNLEVNAAGSITQGNALAVTAGPARFTTTGANHHITLTNDGNAFNGDVALNSAGDAFVRAKSDVKLSGSVGRDLTAEVKGGSILQGDGSVTVMRDTTLTTRADSGNPAAVTDIILENPDNAFRGQLRVNSAGKVSIKGKGDVKLSGWVEGDLKAEAIDGSLLQGNTVLSVGGTSQLTTTSSPGNTKATDVILDNAANSFGGPVALDVAGDATLAAASNVIVNGKVAGTLDVKSAGDIGQNAPLEVDSTTNLSAGGNIKLDNPQNDFKNTVTVEKAVNVEIRDANALDTQGTATGNIVLTAGGDLSQSGPWQVGGTSTLTSENGNVKFDNPNNQFAGLVTPITPNDVDLSAQGPVTMTPNAGGNVTVNAPQVNVVGGSVGGNFNANGKAFLSGTVLVGGANVPMILQNAVQRALTAGLTPLGETGPGSYRTYLLLANPPVILQSSVLPSVEGSGILLPEGEEKKREVSSQ